MTDEARKKLEGKLRRAERKLVVERKALKRKTEGGANWAKQKEKIARIEQKIRKYRRALAL